jgi:hypothetical protein
VDRRVAKLGSRAERSREEKQSDDRKGYPPPHAWILAWWWFAARRRIPPYGRGATGAVAWRDTERMDAGAVHHLPVQPRHFALDERGVGLRATWHADHGFVNVSLWTGDRCVQTFHLTPVEAGRLVGFLAAVLAEAVPEPARPSLIAAVPHAGPESGEASRWLAGLGGLRRDLARTLDRAARRLRS